MRREMDRESRPTFSHDGTYNPQNKGGNKIRNWIMYDQSRVKRRESKTSHWTAKEVDGEAIESRRKLMVKPKQYNNRVPRAIGNSAQCEDLGRSKSARAICNVPFLLTGVLKRVCSLFANKGHNMPWEGSPLAREWIDNSSNASCWQKCFKKN